MHRPYVVFTLGGSLRLKFRDQRSTILRGKDSRHREWEGDVSHDLRTPITGGVSVKKLPITGHVDHCRTQ